jgi:hypothetical protein
MSSSDEAPPTKTSELEFERVEVPRGGGVQSCRLCRRTIGDEYFEMGGQMICGICGRETAQGKGGRAWLRAAGFGAAAAAVGTLIWFLIIKLFHSELGLVAIGVGLLVGLAVRAGSRGRGGWRYQALAVGLTYVSITASYVPMVIDGFKAVAAERDASGKKPGDAQAKAEPAPDRSAKAGAGDVLAAFALVFAFALASPFLAGTSNFMGLVIIAIALYEAWKLNRLVPVSGPFHLAAAPGPVPS